MLSIRRILTLMYKEFFAVWRDKKSRMVLIVPPIIQLFLFSFAATLDVKNVSMGVLNRDHGEKSFELIQRFKGAPTFTEITDFGSIAEIDPFIDNQRGVMVLSIDEQFSRNIDAGKPATVQVLLDGRKSNSAQIVAGYATEIIQQYNQDLNVTVKNAKIKQQKSVIIPQNWFNPNLIYYWFNVPNLAGLLTMLVALLLTALSVARERELGTFDQLLVSPLSPLEILMGKTVTSLGFAMSESVIIVLASTLIFEIPFRGSILLFYLSTFIFSSAIVGVGLFISSLCYTQQQAILGTQLFMSPAILLSGFATPIENMPEWLQVVTYINPLRYFLVIARGVMLKDMSFSVVFSNSWPMALIAVFTLTCATWLFRRRLE